MASKVVISAGQYHQQIAIEPINQAMFMIDASRPAAGEGLTRKLGFADANEGIAEACLDQLVKSLRKNPQEGSNYLFSELMSCGFRRLTACSCS